MGRDRIVGSVPGLLNTISSGSTADIVAAQAEDEPAVPNILSTCIKYLETNGLHTLGLFRVSTSKKRIRQVFDYLPKNDNRKLITYIYSYEKNSIVVKKLLWKTTNVHMT